jgi:pimeloyl-ACP methyl ester carboxylesterase
MDAEPYSISIPDETLRDMRERLEQTRWPDEIPGVGWDYGVSPEYLKGLVDYWRTDFDWRVHEARLNQLANFQLTIDGLSMHVIHERGRGPSPLPLLITHGWPSSCYEAIDLIPMLTDPERYGGDPADSFDVIVPSLPGYGFSERPAIPAVTSTRIAGMLVELMQALGYERFAAHAYDIGASMLSLLCVDFPDRVIAYHTTEPANAVPYLGPGSAPLTEDEQDYLELQERWYGVEGGYDHIQATRPQTLAYGLNDSPAGLAAWIIDKWYTWTEPPSGDLGEHFTPDQLLANATIYWATGTINSANRLYYERDHHPRIRKPDDRISVPAGIALTTQEIERAPREYLERMFTDIRYWRDLGQGGHFVMLECPELLADSLRTFFREFRQ